MSKITAKLMHVEENFEEEMIEGYVVLYKISAKGGMQ